MADKLMTHKIIHYLDSKYWLKRLDTNQSKYNKKIKRLLCQRTRKRYFKTFGISVIKSPMSLSFLNFSSLYISLLAIPGLQWDREILNFRLSQ